LNGTKGKKRINLISNHEAELPLVI